MQSIQWNKRKFKTIENDKCVDKAIITNSCEYLLKKQHMQEIDKKVVKFVFVREIQHLSDFATFWTFDFWANNTSRTSLPSKTEPKNN